MTTLSFVFLQFWPTKHSNEAKAQNIFFFLQNNNTINRKQHDFPLNLLCKARTAHDPALKKTAE